MQHGGVEVEVYFHPAHGENVARMLRAATRTLDLLGEQLGPYPHSALRIAEVPAGWDFGASRDAGLVYLTEDRGFLTDLRDARHVDLVSKRVAHEVAHQWWGHLLDPADVEGSLTLVETLTRHADLRVLESLQGEEALREVHAYELGRYLSGRAELGEREPSLERVAGEAHVFYSKGALVMASVEELLGATRWTVRSRGW